MKTSRKQNTDPFPHKSWLRTKVHQACFAVIMVAVGIMVMTSCASMPQARTRDEPVTLPEPPVFQPTPDRIGTTLPPAPAPTPFRLGEEVQPPKGCLELRARGGEC